MNTLVMSGRPVADACKEQIKEKVEAARKAGKNVTLAIVTVGEDPASFVYRKRLLKMTESLGIGRCCVDGVMCLSRKGKRLAVIDLSTDEWQGFR